MTSEREKIYIKPDTSMRDDILETIADDLDSGELEKLTFAIARKYGLKSDMDIRWAQLQLQKRGLLVKSGNRFRRAA